MADSKLRLQIVTALDNAGIKATKEQIDSLEKSIGKFKGKAEEDVGGIFNKANKGVSKLSKGAKTVMKDITIAIGVAKLLGQAMAATYERMSLEGKSFSESFGEVFDEVKERLRKFVFGTNVAEQFDKISEQFQKVSESQIQSVQKVNIELNKQHKIIDDTTSAYISQASAVAQMRKGVNNAETIALQREKFYEVRKARQEYGDDYANQLEAGYDIKIAYAEGRAELEAHQKATSVIESKMTSELAKLELAQKAMEEQTKKYNALKNRNLENEMTMATAELDPEKDAKHIERIRQAISKQYFKQVKKQEETLEAATQAYNSQFNKTNTLDIELQGREMELANIYASKVFEIEQKMGNFDDIVSQSGSQYVDFVKSDKGDLNYWINESTDFQKQIAENTGSFADKLEALLRVK